MREGGWGWVAWGPALGEAKSLRTKTPVLSLPAARKPVRRHVSTSCAHAVQPWHSRATPAVAGHSPANKRRGDVATAAPTVARHHVPLLQGLVRTAGSAALLRRLFLVAHAAHQGLSPVAAGGRAGGCVCGQRQHVCRSRKVSACMCSNLCMPFPCGAAARRALAAGNASCQGLPGRHRGANKADVAVATLQACCGRAPHGPGQSGNTRRRNCPGAAAQPDSQLPASPGRPACQQKPNGHSLCVR